MNNIKRTIATLLKSQQIKRVVFVDDRVDNAECHIEEIRVAIEVCGPSAMKNRVPELGSLADDTDIAKSQLDTLWESWNFDQQRVVYRKVVELTQQESDNIHDSRIDPEHIGLLSNLIDESVLMTLSPAGWEVQKAELLPNPNQTAPETLFLFDLDLSKAGKARDEGLKIIVTIIKDNPDTMIRCGLLTHMVTRKNHEQMWKEFSQKHGLSRDRFLVLPKNDLHEDPHLFAHALKLMAMLPHFHTVKSGTISQFETAHDHASRRFDDVDIYALEHIVLKIATEEGIWETDMLFNLYSLLHGLEYRKLMLTNSSFESPLSELRSISKLTDIGEAPYLREGTWKLERDRLYEDIGHVNRHHLPIELGDIFRKRGSDSEKRYILLAQPCDLSVRKDGKRARDISIVSLVEINKQKNQETNDNQQNNRGYVETIPCFGDSYNVQWLINFKGVHQVPTAILDLCVFDEHGVARLRPGQNVAPPLVRPGWQLRYTHIRDHWKGSLDKFARLKKCLDPRDDTDAKDMRNQVSNDFWKIMFGENLFSAKRNDYEKSGLLEFNCERVDRLRRPTALGLLTSFMATQGRPAYERGWISPNPFTGRTGTETTTEKGTSGS